MITNYQLVLKNLITNKGIYSRFLQLYGKMTDSILFKVIKSFGNKERKSFGLFLENDYFFKKQAAEEMLELWQLLSKEAVKKKSSLTREEVKAQIYSDQDYYKGKLEKLMTALLGRVHQFILIDGILNKTDPSGNLIALNRFYQKKGLAEHGVKRAEQQLKVLDSKPVTGANLMDAFLLNQFIIQASSLMNDRKNDLNIPNTLDALHKFYFYTNIEYCLQVLAINEWLMPLEVEELVKRVDHNLALIPKDLEHDAVFGLYMLAYELLRNFDKSNVAKIQEFEVLLEKNEKHCSPNQLKSFQTLIRNYCIHFYHKGEDEFIEMAFLIYRKHLDKGLLHHRGKILIGTFRNLVLLAAWNNNLQWCRTFIEEQQGKIASSEDQESIFRFHLATLHFYEKKYELALEHLDLEFGDVLLKYAARRLELMIYYELKSPLFQSKLEAFKIYSYRMSSTKNPEKVKSKNKNFVDFLKQINHPKTFQNEKRQAKIRSKMKEVQYLAEKPWLFSILEQRN